MFRRRLHIAEVCRAFLSVGCLVEQIGIADYRADRSLDVVGDGEHQPLAHVEQVLGAFLGFFQLVAVMVAAGDIAPYHKQERHCQNHCGKCYCGNLTGGMASHRFGLQMLCLCRARALVDNHGKQLAHFAAQHLSVDAQFSRLPLQLCDLSDAVSVDPLAHTGKHPRHSVGGVDGVGERVGVVFRHCLAHVLRIVVFL